MENIPWVLIGFVWLLNMFISWVNARTVGLMWVETKQMGGWTRFMTWMGAIMSASGFTWCYLVALLFGGYYAQFGFLKENQSPWIGVEALRAGFALGYLIIIPGILFSGMMIWIDSLVKAWKRRDFPSVGIAAWNTFAQVHNTYGAIRGVPGAWDAIGGFFGGKGKKDGSIIIILLVILALLGGILTTWGIVLHYAGTRPLPQRENNG